MNLFAFCQDEVLYLQTDSHWITAARQRARFLMETLGLLPCGIRAGGIYHGKHASRHFSCSRITLSQRGRRLSATAVSNELHPCQRAADSRRISDPDTNPDAPNGLLLFRDSFGNTLYPFMAEDFRGATHRARCLSRLCRCRRGTRWSWRLSSATWRICSNIPRISGTKRRRIPSNEQNATGG